MNVRFLTIAEQEIDDTYHWFEERTKGSGLDFLNEIDRVIRRISTYPLAALEIEPEIRRSLLPRFPYAIVYGIDAHTIIVIAVAHTHRKPRYWINRVAE